MRSERILWILAGVAITAHVLFLVLTWPHAIPTSQDNFDARQYRELADSFADGDGFQLKREDSRGPDLDRTPIYPMFVSMFGSGWERIPPVFVAQHVLVIITAWLTCWWTKKRLGRREAVIAAFAIVAFDLTTMTYASYLLTEILFTFFLTVALAAWPLSGDHRPVLRSVCTGIAWGLATLSRPITFYLAPLALALALLARRHSSAALKHAIVAAGVGGLIAGAWIARNQSLSGAVVVSTIEGENILYYRAALVSLPPGKSVEQWQNDLRSELDEGAYDRTDPRQAVALDRARKTKAFELLVTHPTGLHRLLVLGAPRLFFSPNRSYLFKLLGVEPGRWPLNVADSTSSVVRKLFSLEGIYLGASSGYQIVLFLAALTGALSALREREGWAFAPTVTWVYLTILSSGLESHARFRVPLVPILALFAARAVCAAIELRRVS